MAGGELTLAVIVPVINEADRIEALLDGLAVHRPSEIFVVDGGSRDGTFALAAARPEVSALQSPPGRGSQIALALKHARADVVLILHADTELPDNARALICEALAGGDVAGGSFRLRFDDDRWPMRMFAWMTRFETILTTFGDQAMFARRHVLMCAGGIPDWPLLEDVELRRRLRRVGRFVKVAGTVTTSARRFQHVGIWRCQCRNALIVAGYLAGLSPQSLARRYERQRPR